MAVLAGLAAPAALAYGHFAVAQLGGSAQANGLSYDMHSPAGQDTFDPEYCATPSFCPTPYPTTFGDLCLFRAFTARVPRGDNGHLNDMFVGAVNGTFAGGPTNGWKLAMRIEPADGYSPWGGFSSTAPPVQATNYQLICSAGSSGTDIS
ncbi:MAG: hypothetical protein FJZ01_26450 [Candidatus Sericytochromatia bacterium]|nr:hypothetical protein [Candidatus Tanganyikabacteria bacterium]